MSAERVGDSGRCLLGEPRPLRGMQLRRRRGRCAQARHPAADVEPVGAALRRHPRRRRGRSPEQRLQRGLAHLFPFDEHRRDQRAGGFARVERAERPGGLALHVVSALGERLGERAAHRASSRSSAPAAEAPSANAQAARVTSGLAGSRRRRVMVSRAAPLAWPRPSPRQATACTSLLPSASPRRSASSAAAARASCRRPSPNSAAARTCFSGSVASLRQRRCVLGQPRSRAAAIAASTRRSTVCCVRSLAGSRAGGNRGSPVRLGVAASLSSGSVALAFCSSPSSSTASRCCPVSPSTSTSRSGRRPCSPRRCSSFCATASPARARGNSGLPYRSYSSTSRLR